MINDFIDSFEDFFNATTTTATTTDAQNNIFDNKNNKFNY